MSGLSGEDLTCREVVEVITNYLEGAMVGPDRARFEHHLEECTGCTAVLAQFRATIEATGLLTESAVTADQREAMREVFRRWHEGAAPAGPGPQI
ncbi:MAG TPA: zf-HC2 domain-containing protein [Actinomycetota bacterium]|nr:zf-HC2 domain-containing protein [Actinomycetota bacterium]